MVANGWGLKKFNFCVDQSISLTDFSDPFQMQR